MRNSFDLANSRKTLHSSNLNIYKKANQVHKNQQLNTHTDVTKDFKE